MGALLLHSSELLRRPVPGVLGAFALATGGAGVLTAGLRYAHADADAAIQQGRSAGPHPRLVAVTAGLTLLLPLALLQALLGAAGS